MRQLCKNLFGGQSWQFFVKGIAPFRVGVVTLLFFLLVEIFVRMGFVWWLPYKNSLNSNHAQEKLSLLRKSIEPLEIVIIGSSWAEYGVDSRIIEAATKRRTINLSIISSSSWEQIRMMQESAITSPTKPLVFVWLLDYSHLPIKKSYPYYADQLATINDKIFGDNPIEAALGYAIQNYFYTFKYRRDIESAIFGMFWDLGKSGENPYRNNANVSIHDSNIIIWEREMRWKSMQPVASLNRMFNEKEIDAFVEFVNMNIPTASKVLIVRPPIAFPLESNIFELLSFRLATEQRLKLLDWQGSSLVLQPSKHFFDADHLNSDGAKRFSLWLAKELVNVL